MRINWKDSSGKALFIEFDACVQETHTGRLDITSHPVEKGGTVTDHAIPQQRIASFVCVVSDTPIYSPPSQMDSSTGSVSSVPLTSTAKFPDGLVTTFTRNIGGNPEVVDTSGSASVLNFTGPVNRVRNVIRQMFALQGDRTLVNIRSGFGDGPGFIDYDNVLITNLSVPRDAKIANAPPIGFDITQIDFAETQTVQVSSTLMKSKKKADKGKQTKTDIKSQPNVSVQAKILDQAKAGLGSLKKSLGGDE